MAEKDFSKFQKDVCGDITPPPPIKKICPTCIVNPNYIEPDWTGMVNRPYLNEGTCEYTCVVSLDRYGEYLTAADFRSPPQGREVALRQYIEPALRLMLRHFGKLEADAIICASFPGLKLEGLAPDELLELQSDYTLAYTRHIESGGTDVFDERSLEDIPLSQRNSCPPIDEIIAEATNSIYAGENRTTEEGDSFEVFDATKFATGEYPEITNPYALELYAVIKDFDIDPIGNYLKVKVTVPAFVFDQVPSKPRIQLPGGSDTVSKLNANNSVEFLSEDLSPQLTRLSTSLGIYSTYQSLFWRNQDGYLIFSDTQDVEALSAEDIQPVDYYASEEKVKIDQFKDKIVQIIRDNGYEVNSFFSGIGNLVRKVKLEFLEGEIYKLKAVKVEVNGCGYRKLTDGFDNFKSWCDNRPTTMHYVANLKKIDMSLRASQSYPWLDFLVAYTYPQISVVYGRLSKDNLEQDVGSCIVNNANQYAIELRDTILNDSVNLMKALEFEFNNVSCSRPGSKPKFLENEDAINAANQQVYQAQFDKFFAQDSFLKSLIPPDTLRSMSTNPNSSALKSLKDEPKGSQSDHVIKMLTLCNINSVGMAAMRCLFSGTSYQNAMSKIVRVALESMDIDVIGFFIENLPPEDQIKIRQQYEKDFGNLPLPWEAGYDPGSMSNSNPYQKYKDGFIKQALAGQDDNKKLVQLKAESDQSIKDQAAQLNRVGDQLKRVNKISGEIAEVNAQEYNPWQEGTIAGLMKQLESENKVLAGEQLVYEQLLARTTDLEAQISKLSKETSDPNAKKSDLEIWRDLPEEEKKTLADAANRESKAKENTPPGTYGNALGSLQKTITSAYIDYMMDSLQIDVLLQTLDRVPLVGELLPRLLASVKCAAQSPSEPPIDSFLSTLTLDVCGDLQNGLRMPKIPTVPNFFDTALLTKLANIFIASFSQTITKVLVSLMFKLLQTIEQGICDGLNALGQFVAEGDFSGDGFDNALRDAWCPDGDEDDLAAAKNGVFGNLGGFGGDINCLFRTLNSVTSRKENVQLMAGQGEPHVSARIAEAVNTFCPEYGGVMGTPQDVERVYVNCGSYCPPELLQELLEEVNRAPDGPIYESICLTQEELDQFNRDREGLLTANGLDEETARDMIDKANERVLDDLGDVAKIMQQGPQGLMEQAIDDLLSRADPTCSVNKSAILLETPESREQKKGLINDFFSLLERRFFDDLIGEYHSVLASILTDTADNSLKLHELFVGLPIFIPNYVNSEADWEFRKEYGSIWYANDFRMPDIENASGMFPATVGIHMRKQIQMSMFSFLNTDGEVKISGNFTNDGSGEGPDYEMEMSITRKGGIDNKFNINIKEIFYSFRPGQDLDEAFSNDPVIERDRIKYSKPFAYDDSFLEGIQFPVAGRTKGYVKVFENLLKRGLNRPVEINSIESRKVYEAINSEMFTFVREAMLNDPDGGTPIGYKFGYDASQAIEFRDLIYVDPNANPNDEGTWSYTFDEEDRKLGKSATENPRVHFLDPDIHGGSYRRPKIYIEPATYNGWMGMMRTFVPEISSCDENTTNFLDLAQITNRVKEIEDNLPFDERLSLPPECRVEIPFDRQFSPINHGLMDGVVTSTVRVYATEFILKTLPVFSSVEMSDRNIDDIFSDVLIEAMKDGMVDQFNLFNVIQGYTYWLLFLEQSVQSVERMILDEMLEMTPALVEAKEQIDQAKEQFASLGQDFFQACDDIARGSAIIAYGEDWEEVLNDSMKMDWGDVAGLWRASAGIPLSPFRLGLANSINTIWKARDAAKVFLREIVKREITQLSEKLYFNMRPRPHVYDISKYLLSKNGMMRGSTLRAGESKIEAPVTGGKSGIGYGSIFDVPRNILEENVFDNALLTPDELEELNEKGVFYLERYIRTTDKDGLEQVYNIKELQELLSDRAVYDENSKLSDYFGNLELISDDRILVGSLGVQFGVRLMYCPPSAFSYDLNDLDAETNRAFSHKPAMIQLATETSQRPWQLTARTVPIAVFEQDVLDKKIKDINFEDENMGEDLKCYIDNLVQTEEYQVLVDYCFPLKTYVSSIGVYSFYNFFESIGKDPSERIDSGIGLGGIAPDLWKSFIFNESKSTCRKLFNSVYRSDDDEPEENRVSSEDLKRKFFENILPQLYINLDSSISWWQRRRIVKENPFDADGKDCKNAFQKLFDKKG